MKGGTVLAAEGETLSGFTIEFVETKSRWRSGKIELRPDGGFTATLKAENGRPNEFLLELRDPQGNLCEAAPDRIPYTIGLAIDSPPLTHSVGVAMANNEVDVLLPKGTPLPSRKRTIHRTVVEVRKGESGTFIRIPVVEGESRWANRNRSIGYIVVRGDSVRRDVPAGSEVEFTIEIDESRIVRTRAYLPILDEEYEMVQKLEKPELNLGELAEEADQELERLEKLQNEVEKLDEPGAKETLQKIREEHGAEVVSASLAAAQGGEPDAADRCQNRLLNLRIALDQVEDALKWPALVARAREELEKTRELLEEKGTREEKQALRNLEADIEAAIRSRDAAVLERKLEELGRLSFQVLDRRPEFWYAVFTDLTGRKERMKDPELAERLFAQGNAALISGDVERLKTTVRQLVGLLEDHGHPSVPPGLLWGTTIRSS
jgi:molecular chaperone DnaK